MAERANVENHREEREPTPPQGQGEGRWPAPPGNLARGERMNPTSERVESETLETGSMGRSGRLDERPPAKVAPSPLDPGAYDSSHIKVLEGLEAVRKRPDMYIGGTDSGGLHHLVFEVLDNSIDEALAGFCDRIVVKIFGDGSVSILDNGRGIPVDMHETGVSALEVVMTKLHAGGKFDHKAYKVSGGLHGVGVSVVCALSEWLEVESYRNGLRHRQRYTRGHPDGDVAQFGKADHTGTLVRFKPDAQIFESVEFRYEIIAKRCRELAFLNKGLRIQLVDERSSTEENFYFEEGIIDFVRHCNATKEPLHKEIFYFQKDDAATGVGLEVALQYNSDYSTDNIFSFANNIHTVHGGTHLSGFKSALTRTLNKYARDNKVSKESDDLPEGNDYLEGLVAVVSVKVPDPKFESQTKVKLSNTEVEGIVQQIVNEELGTVLEENPQSTKVILLKALQAKQAREAARKARDLIRRKTVLSSGSLPAKLADCSSRDPDKTELYIVEGDSAGGSAKTGRVRQFQAILPIRGKILNVEKTRIDKMLSHQEIQTIIAAIGTGIGEEDFDISKLRYGKIIIMTDADVDGSHIRTLLLTFFFRQMPKLIEESHLFIAQPPLFKMTRKGKERYIQDEKEYERVSLETIVDGAKLVIDGNGNTCSSEALLRLATSISRLGRHEDNFRKKEISLSDYLARRRSEDGRLPLLAALRSKKAGNHNQWFFFSEGELQDFLHQLKAERGGQDVAVATEEDPIEKRDASEFIIYEFYERDAIEKLCSEILAVGALPLLYRDPRLQVDLEMSREERPRPIAKLHRDDGDAFEEVFDLAGLLDKLYLAMSKVDVQRFKGLGEMNPEQLFETTMNPETRTLLLVSMKDAFKADEYFSILMGTDVESRRKFIQEHALEVKNLDV
jgi:DNA gyrase subunit B